MVRRIGRRYSGLKFLSLLLLAFVVGLAPLAAQDQDRDKDQPPEKVQTQATDAQTNSTTAGEDKSAVAPAEQPSVQEPAEQEQEPAERDQKPAEPEQKPTEQEQKPPEQKTGSEPAQQHPVPVKYDVNKIGNRGIGDGVNFYSLNREIAMGHDLAQQVDASSRMITDPMVTDYINRLGQNIVRNSDAKVPFTIKVIDNDEVNAFALPGGFFYVNSGLILAADNEAELAGVMAHEVAHVAARHATKAVTRNQLVSFASVPLIFVGGPLVFAMEQVAGIAVPMSFLKFSRDAEREADLLGLEYQYEAGYDPAAFVQFFEKLAQQQKQKHGMLAKAFATHPMTDDRIRRAQDEIQQYLPSRSEYLLDTSEFEQVKAHLAMLVNGRRLINAANGRPTLHRPGHPTLNTGPSHGSSTDDSAGTSTKPSQAPGNDDDSGPPTLKRQ